MDITEVQLDSEGNVIYKPIGTIANENCPKAFIRKALKYGAESLQTAS